MTFKDKHIGITPNEKTEMLDELGFTSINDLCNASLAKNIEYNINHFIEMNEQEYENHITKIGKKNQETISLIGQGFHQLLPISYSTKHPRKPKLVYSIHPLSS